LLHIQKSKSIDKIKMKKFGESERKPYLCTHEKIHFDADGHVGRHSRHASTGIEGSAVGTGQVCGEETKL
jgi:CDGSH-type Zn-finger protein